MVSSKELPKQRITIDGKSIAYVDIGTGDPIVFLHGNPTSSYLWRNIMPDVSVRGRCVAPDLIGMGDSEKLDNPGPNSYSFTEHRKYLDKFLKEMGLSKQVTLVVHDWGSALGFDWARRHPDAVKGIAYMEAIVRPITWAEWNQEAQPVFQAFRSPAGETMILEKNIFVERVLPGSVLRELTKEEMTIYRRPFVNPGEDRRPTLTWPRQIPIEGKPPDVTTIVSDYAGWLVKSEVPKLFINATPGAILIGRQRDFCRTWLNQTEVTVAGSHFIQEDSPGAIAKAILGWLQNVAE